MGRQGSTDRVVFDLEDDDGPARSDLPEAEPGSGSGSGDGPAEFSAPVRPWWRRRRLWLVLVVVLGLAATVAVDEASERRELAARLTTAPGGVISLADSPREQWHVDGATDAWPTAELVVATVDGMVVGLDPANGRVVESFGPQATTRCGPEVGRPEFPVCVPEQGDDDADVAAVGRVPGPDGTYLTTARIGPEPAHSPVSSSCDVDGGDGRGGGSAGGESGAVGSDQGDDQDGEADGAGAGAQTDGECVWFGAITHGRNVRVQATDPETGDARWRRTVTFRTVGRAERCVDGDKLDIESVALTATADTVLVEGCGIDAWIVSGGRLLERARTIRGGAEVLARPGGGYKVWARQGPIGTGLTLMFGPDGRGERDASGVVLDPVATDGTGDPMNLVRRGGRLLRVGEDGRMVWDVEQSVDRLLAQTQRAGVLLDGGGVAIGFDLDSGETRWRTEVGVPGNGAWSGYTTEVAFTDGKRMMILVDAAPNDEGDSGRSAIALDLRSGEELWTWDVPEDWEIRAVHGRLVAQTDTGLVGLR